ncbi:unnamed protein product, partial [Mesorhabditis spiculigera]
MRSRGISACFIIQLTTTSGESEKAATPPLRALTRAISAVFLNAADKFNVTAASVDESEGLQRIAPAQSCSQSFGSDIARRNSSTKCFIHLARVICGSSQDIRKNFVHHLPNRDGQAAEQALRFEHRDLHIGNVLVFKKPRPRDHVATVNGEEFCFHDAGVSVRIIDFTLARFGRRCQTHYHKLKEDDALFEGDDSEPHHQIYRDMKEFTGGNWRAYYPVTNRIWRGVPCRAFVRSKQSNSLHNLPRTLLLLHRMLDELEDCSSAYEFIHTTAFTRTVTYLDSLRDGNPR